MAVLSRKAEGSGMVKITLEVPEELAAEFLALEARLKKLEADRVGVEKAIPESDIEKITSGISLALKRRSLQGLDVDERRILINGDLHARVGRYESAYNAKEGPVTVMRSIYRRCGERNGPTVDTVTLRSGAVDSWLPSGAQAAAFLLQQGTSREAEATANELGVYPYSRSSFERVAHTVGAAYGAQRERIDETLIRAFVLPAEARSVSVSIDRVAVPFEEPRARPPGRPKEGTAKRPVSRVWHMAYVGTVTLHDATGEALHTIRYGRVPDEGKEQLVDGLASDCLSFLRQKRSLKVVVLTDGAPELIDALDAKVNREMLGVDVVRMVDFWHVTEKLGTASRAIHGDGGPKVLDRWKALLLNSDTAVARIRSELEGPAAAEPKNGADRPIHAALTYLDNRGERMGYAAARRRGLPIGSGNVEATCKSLVGQRMVRTGSRWKQETAQDIIDLRALALSSRWKPAIALVLTPGNWRIRAAA